MMKRISVFLLLVLSSLPSFAEDAVVARVNGVAITTTELEAGVEQRIPGSSYHGSVSEEKRAELREKALEDLIIRELQRQDASARGMKADKARVKERMGVIRERFKSKKEYIKALEQGGITEAALRSRIEKDELVRQVILITVTEPSRVSDADVKEYYEKNIDKYTQPESVQLRLLSAKDEKKAAEALAKIQAGEDFGNVAATMSEDKFRIKGGDIGYQHRGKLLPELDDAAFALKPGEMSGLIKTQEFWFIIKVVDKKAERQMTFDESKDKIKKNLESKRATELAEKWIAALKAKAKIELVGKE